MASIGIDIRVCSDHFPGIGRVTYNLVRALADLPHSHELVLLHNPRLANSRFDLLALNRLPRVRLIELPLGVFAPQNQWRVPLLARRLRLDLLHTPYYVAPYGGLPCPGVVTIYDIIGHRFPQYLNRRGRLLFTTTTRLALRTSQAVLTGSHSARDDLLAAYGAPQAKLWVTPFGVEGRFRPQPRLAVAQLQAKLGIVGRYVLYVGSNKPHKNLERLLCAWQRLTHEQAELLAGWQLVLAGLNSNVDDPARRFVAEHGLHDVMFLPNVADDDLPTLYSGAAVFAFVSLYEGFGLPPLEALACGAPVLCSNASSLPEVVGDAALTVDPVSSNAIADGLMRLLQNDALRRHLRAAGLERAQQFPWRRTAETTLAVYEQLLTSKR